MSDRQPPRRPRTTSAGGSGGRGLGTAAALVAGMVLSAGGHLLSAWAARPPHGPAARSARPGPGRVPVLRLRRPGQAATSQVWIYRPPVPDSAALPVVYFLHGNPGQPADIFHAGLRRAMDAYIGRGGAPFVIAAPDGNSSLHLDTEWANASDGTDEVESFLLGTVVPAVEGAHRRTLARRAIAGFSMGGYGAVNIALRHPDLFGQIVAFAGYFQPDDPSQMFATAQARLANTPTANLGQASGKRVLLLEDRDEPMALVRGQSSSFQRQLAGHGAAAVARTEPGRHDLAFVISQIPQMAGFLDRGFAAAAGA